MRSHFHFENNHGPEMFLTATKILDAYPETTAQQRTILNKEREINDASTHKMKWKSTYSKAPYKLICQECSCVLLRLQDEKLFHYCGACWRRSNHTFRYELCTSCFTKASSERQNSKASRALERQDSKGLQRMGSKDSAFGFGEGNEPPALELGGLMLSPRQQHLPNMPTRMETGRFDEPILSRGGRRTRRASQGDAVAFHARDSDFASAQPGHKARIYVPPPAPTMAHTGIHPAAMAFVPPAEPNAFYTGVHPAATQMQAEWASAAPQDQRRRRASTGNVPAQKPVRRAKGARAR